VHRFVTGLGLQESQILAIVPVLLVGDQVVRVTLFKSADVTAIVDKHGGPQQHVLESRTVQVLIKDPNVDEKFERILDYPPNANMEVLKVGLREFGSVLDLREDRYARAIAGMIPCLTGEITVRMPLSATIPSYLQVGDYKVYKRYSKQPITCGECNLTGHMATACPQKLIKIPPAASKPSSRKGPMAPKVVTKTLAREIVPVLSTKIPPPPRFCRQRRINGARSRAVINPQPCWRDYSFLIQEIPSSEAEPIVVDLTTRGRPVKADPSDGEHEYT
jgi:hypothetical protein